MSKTSSNSKLENYIKRHGEELASIVAEAKIIKEHAYNKLSLDHRIKVDHISKYDFTNITRLLNDDLEAENFNTKLDFVVNKANLRGLTMTIERLQALLKRDKHSPQSYSRKELNGLIRHFDSITGNIERLHMEESAMIEKAEKGADSKQRELHMSLLRLQADAPDYRGALLDLYENIIYEFGDLTSDSLKNDVTRLVNDLKKTEVHSADESASQSEYQELLDSIQKHRH